MAELDVNQILRIVPEILKVPTPQMWTDYDQEADVLYINFKKPSHADDTQFIGEDVIVRYEKEEIVGITILNASKFMKDPE
ncbi:MAG TPA: DUF2283 domain-containing protein [Candidatus Lokiarchaeia archaeon]|nr:DUF2283 domain-containing protein [Candidatus Lokiarchaeia archaeon]